VAGNNFDWTVIIRLATQGAKSSQADLMAVAAAADRLGKRNKWSEQTLNSLSKGIGRAASSAQSATQQFNRLQQAAQGGQNYRNISTSMDAMIAAQERERRIASDAIKARMQEQARLTAVQQREADKRARAEERSRQQQIRAAQRAAAAEQREIQRRAAAEERARQQQIRAAERAHQRQVAAASSPALRYALYDVSRQAAVVATAIAGIGTAAVASAASFESAFTNVERTLDDTVSPEKVEAIRQELLDMSTEIPKSFQELSSIATLGNQLGVSEDKLAAFTDTVAKFSAISGVSAEETAKAFGSFRITLGLSEDEFENFGSAVELVGRKSAATDAEIIALTREIGQQAHQAGFTADQVVALAGTLGELRVPPERARGSLTTYFQTLNAAVAGGGKDLENFARVLGYTGQELSVLVRNGRGVEVFQRFLANLNSQDTVEQTEALQELGLSQLRVTDTFQRLGSAAGVFNEFLQLSSNAYTENTELGRQYALVVDDIASRWKIFLNSLQGFAAAVGSVIGPAVVTVLDGLSKMLQGITAFANTSAGKGIIAVAAAFGAVVTAVAGVVSALALGGAALVAWRFLMSQLSIAAGTATGQLAGLAGALFGVGGAAGASSVALRAFRLALISTGIGALIVALGTVIGLFVDFEGTVSQLADVLDFAYDYLWKWVGQLAQVRSLIGGLYGVVAVLREITGINVTVAGSFEALGNMVNDVFTWIGERVREAVQGFMDFAQGVYSTVESVIKFLGPIGEAIAAPFVWAAQVIGNVLGQIGRAAEAFGAGFAEGTSWFDDYVHSITASVKSASDAGKSITDLGATMGAGALAAKGLAEGAGGAGDKVEDLGDKAGGAAKQVRTLVDYANDLKQVWDRAFSIRFDREVALDKITSNFYEVADATAEAERNIRSLKAEISGLQSDLNIQQQFLAVAQKYGDTTRAAAIQADIAKTQADLADKTADLNDEQSKNSKTLKGNSKAAIANREILRGMAQDQMDYINALAASGASQKQLDAAIKAGKQAFIDQAVALGYNRNEVERYAKSFDDMGKIVKGVPKDVTVKVNANTDPALAALREFEATAKKLGGKTFTGPTITAPKSDPVNKNLRDQMFAQWINDFRKKYGYSPYQSVGQLAQLRKTWDRGLLAQFAEGGYTGPGGKYEPAGIVHKGEYVIPKKDVNQATGLPYADALGRLQRGVQGRTSYAGGGYVSGGGGGRQTVDLSAFSIQQLAQVMDKFVVVNGRVVAETATNQFGSQTTNGDY